MSGASAVPGLVTAHHPSAPEGSPQPAFITYRKQIEKARKILENLQK
ncbi:MAG: hypothetical protein K2K93_12200 [Muribaculaceae bacterium]|nr:hypothetical protein [Muribaculaceae bacterium]